MKRSLNYIRNTFHILLIRAAGLPCGAFGGTGKDKSGKDINRWCVLPFGHGESCAYDVFEWWDQPGWKLRRWGKGYRDEHAKKEQRSKP